MSLYLDITVGDTIIIGDGVRITAEHKSGRKVRLSIDADKQIPVDHESKSRGVKKSYNRQPPERR